MKWDELLRQLPDDATERAARARRRALARLGEPEPARRRWVWAPVAATAVMLGVLWFRQAWRVETLAWQPPAPAIRVPEIPAPAPVSKPSRRAPKSPERLQVQLALSDGTRVYWTFDRNFNWRGTL